LDDLLKINFYNDKIILVDKPLDWTSNDIICKMKKFFDIKKAGHSGTLDPRATGLLIICTGKKTKVINELIGADKDYTGIFRIGATTPTLDTETKEENILENFSVTDEEIDNAVSKFQGEIYQTPPIHSAIKQNGKPVYKAARRGEEVILEPRKVFINKFEAKNISDTEVEFFASVSKGTYIRTLADDFGKVLKTGAYLKSLRRIRIGNYTIEMIDEDMKNDIGFNYRVME